MNPSCCLVSAVPNRASCRFELTRLHRISVGPIVLGDVEESSCRELSRKEVEALYKRCLPENPLCPTARAVERILAARLAHAARRASRAAGLAGRHPSPEDLSPRGTAAGLPEEPKVGGGDPPPAAKAEGRRSSEGEGKEDDDFDLDLDLGRRRAKTTARVAAKTGAASARELADVVELVIDFARRYLHETPPGPAGESAGENYSPGEAESLAQARAVPPNEAHMVCGYRCSQIERLGLSYGVV